MCDVGFLYRVTTYVNRQYDLSQAILTQTEHKSRKFCVKTPMGCLISPSHYNDQQTISL